MELIGHLEKFALDRGLLFRADSPGAGVSDAYVYSPDMLYRYAYARLWRAEGPVVLWVGVNPAKGDTEKRRRPTLERCVRWSQAWDYAGLLIGNLFAARHNKPKGLRESADPVGPHNDSALRVMTELAARTVAAWGNEGLRDGRPHAVAGVLREPLCFGVTSSGQPRHPLYVPAETPLEPWVAW